MLNYHADIIENLTFVPKYFFTPDILQIRRPLATTARRAGYVGSFILYGNIPDKGKIAVIESHREIAKSIVMKNYAKSARLRIDNMNLRGWLIDVLKCLDRITHKFFTLNDIYSFESELTAKHPENHNIAAKIRQQLQFLRDKGFVEFLGRGRYRKVLESR